jgi:hypothetical protein
MSELDPLTFLIATELLTGSDDTSSHRRRALVRPHTISSPTLILLAERKEDDGIDNGPGCSDACEELRLRAQRDFGTDAVRLAYLHSDSSSLSDVVGDLLSARIHQIRILPLFLSDARRVAGEIALEIHELQEKYAALEIELLPAIGEDTRFQRLLWQMVRENAVPEWLAKTS